MISILKELKKSIFSIFVIIALLIVQATCDLSLPSYTSNIVNVGIEQGGITEEALSVVSETEMQHLQLFMDEEERAVIEKSYRLLDKGTLEEEEYQKYVQKYALLKKEKIYIYDGNNDEEVISILKKPSMMTTLLSGDNEVSKQMREAITQNVKDVSMDVFSILSLFPKEQIQAMMEEVEHKLSEYPEMIVDQMYINYLKTQYEIVGMDMEKVQTHYIFTMGLKMLLLALLSMIATIMVGFLGARVAARLAQGLRTKVFGKVVGFSNTEFKEFSTASLITRTTNDIQQIQMLTVMLLRVVFYAPILGVGGVIKVLHTNTSMAWIIAVAVMAILSLVLVLFGIAMPKFKIVQKCIDKLNLVSRELLTGLPVIRAFSREEHEEKRFDQANHDLTKTNLFVNRVMSLMMPMMMFIMNVIMIVIVWYGAKGIDTGSLQVGDMLAFIQYTMQIIMAFLMISMLSIVLPRASVSAKRIDEVLKRELVITDPSKEEINTGAKRGTVEFKNVSFKYPDADSNIIENVSFVANPGETTAFIGSTGSGKSTLINLIPRFFDVSDGSILVDGVDIRHMKQSTLRKKIGYVPQTGILFSGTIESNVKFGNPNITKEELDKAITVAQAKEFIESKPEKLKTQVAQGGTNVSGGQKQRLSIARAIAKNPEIYIFDDSFSALDLKTDAALRSALAQHTKDSTVLIVAQRISTIMNADKIIVMNEGKAIAIGKHKELLETCDIYRQIAESQLGKEELYGA